MTTEAEAQETTDAGESTSDESTQSTLGSAADESSEDTTAGTEDKSKESDGEAADTTDDDKSKTDDDTDKDSDEKEGKDDDESDPEPFDASKLEMPEGFEIDNEMLESFKPIAEKLGLSHEDGKAMVDLHTQAIQKVYDNMLDHHNTQTKTWASEAQSDDEIGGNNWKESLASGEKALTTFGTDGLKQVLKESGLANHPEVIRFVSRIGKAVSEDSFSTPDAGTGQKTGLEGIYDHPTSKT